MAAHPTFSDIINDFAFATYSLRAWQAIPPAQWEAILKDAKQHDLKNKTNWWHPILTDIHGHAGIWEYKNGAGDLPLSPKYDVIKIPQWLLNHDRRTTYFGRIPNDIMGVITSYMRHDKVINLGLHVRTITSLCGFLHSFDRRPAIVQIGPDGPDGPDYCYSWYKVNEIQRDDNLPSQLDVFGGRETATWHYDDTPIRSHKRIDPKIKYAINPGDPTCIRGDCSEMDQQFDRYFEAVK